MHIDTEQSYNYLNIITFIPVHSFLYPVSVLYQLLVRFIDYMILLRCNNELPLTNVGSYEFS